MEVTHCQAGLELQALELAELNHIFQLPTSNLGLNIQSCNCTGCRSPTGAEEFSSSLCVQTGSGAHPASCTVGTGGLFRGGKARPGRDADHSPPSSTEVRNE
jgi:hypothetical protein